ncbi:MAG: hypothetical protein N4A61_02395 [Pelagimonas sp.]|jgi:hypothetical protein|nr:hypothetical protein [Pelagimonas sp.]
MADSSFLQVLLPLAAGSFFGTLLGPVLLEEIRHRLIERRWKKPRKNLLSRKLSTAGGKGWVSLARLTTLTGTTEDDCRSLLIEIGARGGRLKSGKEGWALISRCPLTESGEEVEEKE